MSLRKIEYERHLREGGRRRSLEKTDAGGLQRIAVAIGLLQEVALASEGGIARELVTQEDPSKVLLSQE